MRAFRCLSVFAVFLFLPKFVRADVVLDWNEQGVAVVLAAKQPPPDGARAMTIMHVAMFNAMNAIERRYAQYRFETHAPAGASTHAAAASAARTVLLELFPEQRQVVEKAYAFSMTQISGESGIEAGIALGELAAHHCLALRAHDGVGVENRYRPVTSPGVYVPTTLPISYEWRDVTPWFMKQPSQFRPEPPPSLASTRWARDYNEIKELGARSSRRRTAEQTEVARFWTAVGIATWNPIVRSLATAQSRNRLDNARLFALVNMAASDAFVAVFDSKYTFNFWRPITAIRNGDGDGNDATEADPAWVPFVDTPMHPEYPCAHCITASAVGTVLEAEFGKGKVKTIVMTSSSAPGVSRHWERIADYVEEVKNARIWGGIHYRSSTEVADRMGKEIGRLALASVMQSAH